MAEDSSGGPRLVKSEKLLKCELKAKKLYWEKRIWITDSGIILLILVLKETNYLVLPWNIIGIMTVFLLFVNFIVLPEFFKVSRSIDPRSLVITAKYLETKIANQKKRIWSLYDRLLAFKKEGITTSYDKHEIHVKVDVKNTLKSYEDLLEEVKDLLDQYFDKK
jgi:uncharacterized membrane protein YbhN (UPF0104 family)